MRTKTREIACATAQLAKLHTSLSEEQREQLDASLVLAENVGIDKAIKAVCPLCDMATDNGEIRKASRSHDGTYWWHPCSVNGIFSNKPCAADLIWKMRGA